MSRFSPDQIRRILNQDWYQIHFEETIDSTNEWAKREAAKGAGEGSVYLADTQTMGKGSRGRSWESPQATSISMSLILRPQIPLDRVSMLTLCMGMAACDGINRVSGLKARIKWPNDVVYNGKKLCGILTEMGGDLSYVVPGIGINVNVPDFPEELQDKASSLYLETGREFSREEVTAAVLSYFEKYYKIFLETGDMKGLRERYQELLINRDRRVRVIDPKEPFDGVALGIDERGDLLIRRDDGEIVKVFAGEVSVRGIYGYV